MIKKYVSRHDYPVADTADGKLLGYEWDEVLYFKGIRYAAAKRFHQPEPVSPWEGIKPANTCGPVAPVYGQGVPRSDFHVPHRYWPMNEDCQYLNVWTKHLDAGARKPVLVWLHGGGFAGGSAMEGVSYDGDELCRYGDVVTVSVNHRLNILGYLDLSAFGEEYANSVNAGIADLVEALRWIRRNISAFGGDPDNVTIFGQSGGGGKVISLLQTYEAAGLFHKAIIISGAANLMGNEDVDHSVYVHEMLKELHFGEDQVKELETVPYDILFQAYLRAAAKLGKPLNWGPVKNEWFHGYPTVHGFTEHAKKIPVIVGTAIGEFNAYFGPVPAHLPEAQKRAMLDKQYGGHGEEVLCAFRKAYPAKDTFVASKVDTMFRQSAVEFARQRVKECEAPTWVYIFGLVFPINDATPCWHSGDIPFFTHTTSRIPNANIEGVTERLEAEVSGAVLALAANGDPNHEGLIEWPPYTAENEETMIFDERSEVKNHPDAELAEALKRYAPPARSLKPVLKAGEKEPERVWYY
ncbi:MAG: carboxylesterase/lipase family protein [Firmicutes bacterium]|nr:carboxylesterase/lipase family protein [Bacillota bacterium]